MYTCATSIKRKLIKQYQCSVISLEFRNFAKFGILLNSKSNIYNNYEYIQ